MNAVPSVPARARKSALVIAVVADAIQLGLLPLFAGGGWMFLDGGLDLVVAVLLIRRLGWHWAFLPTFAAELMPWLDLFPTWTAAVWFVSRSKASSVEGQPT